jgi:hypothetical protein
MSSGQYSRRLARALDRLELTPANADDLAIVRTEVRRLRRASLRYRVQLRQLQAANLPHALSLLDRLQEAFGLAADRLDEEVT